ncbi:hypothetical protein H072_6113 [Dactylellina haptotyla CBS 200.50]|uniref:Aminoacyl-transfer RNA synthetases class-II family profile domain-containing protein n=1 Tax=Dactylellina haptotyla (strain CBS 200.50) TaxID=1284197 RepID=S8AFZ4_DACHA|nr:hypothetical protein H072_6113 [Dactylellina haptotyla CBS 200.50]
MVSPVGRRGLSQASSKVTFKPASPLALQTKENPDVEARWEEISTGTDAEYYPRIIPDSNRRQSIKAFRKMYSHLETESQLEDKAYLTTLYDVASDGFKVQIVSSLKRSEASQDDFDMAYAELRRGDIISITGSPGKTRSDELSLYSSELPQRLAASLHLPPPQLEDGEKRAQSRHVDLMVNLSPLHILLARSFVINWIRKYLLYNNFTEVSTPILAELSGGAAAKPFETASRVFGDSRKLQMRIAPELWLKRLVIGGLERVFEIGPNFRNENADATHNPEFYSCEFYEAYADIETLKQRTTNMLVDLFHEFEEFRAKDFPRVKPWYDRKFNKKFKAPFQEIDFIGGIEKAMGRKLPLLHEPGALEKLLEIIDGVGIERPVNCTLPGVLDYLASTYIEPECMEPTFVTDIPACLSPLSKTSNRISDNQVVAHRAELYVNGKELANLYEEENSPFQQRMKFIEQSSYRVAVAKNSGQTIEKLEESEQVLPEMPVDESYIGALEWGLPPTGGWGIGLDRLVMLLCDAEKIGDVMAFGGLRATVLAGRGIKPIATSDPDQEPKEF